MRGSIRRRGRTYTWYLFVLDPATGKPRQRSKGGYRTKRECQAALNEALSTVRTGTFVEASKRTTGGFLRDEWLPAMRLNVRPSTWASYQGLLEAYVIPTLGGVELQQLTPAHLTSLYQELLASGRRHRPGGLAPKTVRNVHVLIHRALKDAVRWGYTFATWRTPWTRRRRSQLSCRCGHRDSSVPSSFMSGGIATMPPGCWRRRPVCAVVSSWGCVGSTSIWLPAESPSGSRASWSTTPSTPRSPRRPGADGPLHWTPRRWLLCGSTKPARRPSGW